MPDRQPRRIQRQRTRGWRMPKDAVYVGRLPRGLAGWGNPFIVSDRQTRRQAVDNFRAALTEGRLQYSVAKVRRELAGKDLVCWCPEGEPCHADVLLEVANTPSPLTWQPVKDPQDRRKVVYWRLGTGRDGEWVGAVSHREEGWRALRYDYIDKRLRSTELGTYPTRQHAVRLVEAATSSPSQRASGDAAVQESR